MMLESSSSSSSGAPSRRRRLQELALVAVAFGLATAIAQLSIQFVQLHAASRILFASRDVVWMAPLGYTAIFLLLAAGGALLALVSPRLVPVQLTLFGFAFLGAFSLTLPFSGIARWAAALLSAGLAAQVARVIASDPSRWMRRLARASIVVAALVAVTGLAGRAWRWGSERQRVASLPDASSGAPNVLLIILDTVRAASMSAYGYARPTTPSIERLAGDGVLFERAYATAPWTLPSHATMFTGRYSHETETDWLRPLERAWPTLAEAFAARGYLTAGFMANNFYTAWDSGLHRGFQRWDDYRVSAEQTLLSTWLAQATVVRDARRASTLAEANAALREFNLEVPVTLAFDERHSQEIRLAFERWHADRADDDRPFFAVLNLFDAHRPRYSPPEVLERFAPTRRGPDTYDAAIAHMDEQVGILLDTLRARGALENTVVVVTADHGELLGEHGLYGHSTNLYQQALHVPLVVRFPARLPAGARVTAPVTLRDLARTIVDLAGLRDETRFPGTSLATLAVDAARRHVPTPSPILSEVNKGLNLGPASPSSRGPMRSLVDGQLHYILNGDGVEQIFDLAADPAEQRDLRADPLGDARRAGFRQTLASLGADR